MIARSIRLSLVALAGVAFSASHAWAIGFELGQSKEELGLKYEVTAVVHESGRVSVTLVIADQGKLKPLQSVKLAVPSQDGTGYFDLSVLLATSESDGKLTARAHLSRDLAERGSIQLVTRTVDGKEEPRTWYYHAIKIADYIQDDKKKDND